MSLNFDLRKCENWEELWMPNPEFPDSDAKVLVPFANQIILYTMVIDMGSITEENWKQFYQRVYVWQRTCGNGAEDGSYFPNYLITMEQVRRMIGLSTNVITKSATAWRKQLALLVSDNLSYEFRKFDTVEVSK